MLEADLDALLVKMLAEYGECDEFIATLENELLTVNQNTDTVCGLTKENA